MTSSALGTGTSSLTRRGCMMAISSRMSGTGAQPIPTRLACETMPDGSVVVDECMTDEHAGFDRCISIVSEAEEDIRRVAKHKVAV